MGFPMSVGRLDGRISMTWVTFAAGVVVADGATVTASLVAGGSGLSLDDVEWLPWVVNMAVVQGLESGDPQCDHFRSLGVYG